MRKLRPTGLGTRGAALWADLAEDGQPAARAVLLGEGCRLADRLDRLDALLRGEVKVWARLTHRLLTEDYELHIDAAASEARQTASTLRLILGQLAGVGEAASSGASKPAIEDEMERRRANRRSGT